jgi:release factor glutamine methyltransferase
MVAERIAGRPLEYIVGWVEFCGLRLSVADGVFVPRRRTQALAGLAAAAVDAVPGHRVAVDLCCGAGAVAGVIAARCPDAEVHAADLDPAAVACARRNLGTRGTVHRGDLFAALPPALRGRVDVLAANAPYVPSEAIALMPPEAREHEPRLALDGGPDGLAVQRRVIAGAAHWLAPGGTLLIETGPDQAAGTVAAMRAAGLTAARTVRDTDLEATVAVAALAGC